LVDGFFEALQAQRANVYCRTAEAYFANGCHDAVGKLDCGGVGHVRAGGEVEVVPGAGEVTLYATVDVFVRVVVFGRIVAAFKRIEHKGVALPVCAGRQIYTMNQYRNTSSSQNVTHLCLALEEEELGPWRRG
jgi:hypothetical protein